MPLETSPSNAATTLRRVVALLIGATLRRLRRILRGRQKRLRVGVDIRPFYEPLTGVGWYLYYLLRALAAREDIELVGFGDARITNAGPWLQVDLPAGMEHRFIDLRDLPPTSFNRRLTAAAYLLLLRLEGCELIFGANYFLPRLMSAVARRRVITIHDLTFRRYPELMQSETLADLRGQMTREILNADAIISVSEATRRDILKFYEVDPSKVITIHSGVAPVTHARNGWSPDPPYILFVGTIEPRKDVETLLRAFDKLKAESRYDGSLVLVGKVGWKSQATMDRIQKSRWKDSILHLSYLDTSALSAVYERAQMLVFPSLHEGFGFPLLEAMAYGVPVIAAANSSLPEVGGEAALYFDSRDWKRLAELIDSVARDPALRSSLVSRGRDRVEKFQWSDAADRTLRLFQRVARA